MGTEQHTNPITYHDTDANSELLERDERTSDLGRCQFGVVPMVTISWVAAYEEFSILTEERSWIGYRHRDQ